MFAVINADEYDSVIAQQGSRQPQPWVHHVEPIRMKSPRGFGVRTDLASASVYLAGEFEVVLNVVPEIVGVHEVLAGVVRWIDINELDLLFSAVRLLQKLQDFQVVALNHQVSGRFPVHALFGAWAQCSGGRCERKLASAALAVPVEAIFLLPLLDHSAQELLQHLEVHLLLGERLGKDRLQLFNVLRNYIWRLSLGIFRGKSLHLGNSFLIVLDSGLVLHLTERTHLFFKGLAHEAHHVG